MNTIINSVGEKHTFDATKIIDVSNCENNKQIINKNDNECLTNEVPSDIRVGSESKLKNVFSSTSTVTTSTTVKSTRMLPLVYIQTPTNLKVPTSTATSTGTKQTFAYLGTIIKPSQAVKASENQIGVPPTHLQGGLTPTSTNQKLLFTSMAMPKLTPRIPITCSTVTSNQPKLSSLILPMTISNNQIKNTNQSIINFKISNGQIQSDPKGGIKVLCDNKAPNNNNIEKEKIETITTNSIKQSEIDSTTVASTVDFTKTTTINSTTNPTIDSRIECNEEAKLTNDAETEKSDKVYELSISEIPTSTANELSYTISIPEEKIKTNKVTKVKKGETRTKSIRKETKGPKLAQSINISKPEPQQVQRKISILKKCNLSTLDRKQIPSKSSDTTTETKPENSENESTKNSEVKPQPIPEVRKINPERRRKSQYTYLRDFDEVVVTSGNAWENKNNNIEEKAANKIKSNEITVTKLDTTDDKTKETETKKVDDIIEIELVNKELDVEIPQLGTEDDEDIRKLLKWKEGIGTLVGTKIKFRINEFGIIEMLAKDELDKVKSPKVEEERPTGKEILCCRECNTYGMPSEFITQNFCSKTCKIAAVKSESKRAYLQEVKAKRKKKKLELIQKQKSEDMKKEVEETQSRAQLCELDDDNNSNDMLQDNKYRNYPWQTGKKGFSWSKYLDHVKGKAAPIKLFKDPFPYVKNGFRPGMKLEGIDPQHPSYFCVMTVSEVQGYRIRLHFDGYPENYDFWVNADSLDIFPIGWCEKNNHSLHPPPGYNMSEFNWNSYLKQCKATAAPRQLFAHRAGNSACPHGFRLGMKLEAVDKKNTSLICVATVTDLMDNRFLVHFDSWDDIYDYWADPTSPYIHPVGWCDQYGHNLTPPNDYPEPETFTWEKYLKETKSTAAPVRAFKQRPSNGFKRDMRLEIVDKRLPSLIRVSTVEEVRDHQIKIRFDGWPNKYSYWTDDDSPDIHPAGWCQKTGHPLESPLTPEDVYETYDCPTIGCKGIGHVQGAKFTTHNNSRDCPYSDENLDGEFSLIDRLILTNQDFIQESVVPVSREPPKDKMKTNNRMGRPPKIRRLTETSIKAEWLCEEDDVSDLNRKRKLSNRETTTSPLYTETKLTDDVNCRYKPIIINDYNTSTTTSCPSQQILAKHSKILNEIISTNSQDARLWTHEEVAEFVSSLPSCREHSALFINHKIDGEAFLMLTQKDLVDILKFKLGPAIKLYNSIVLLRKNVSFYD